MILVTHLPAASGAGVGVGSNNPDTKNPYTFNESYPPAGRSAAITLNDPTDDPNETYELVTAAVMDQFSLQSEPRPQQDGMQIYIPRKVRKVIHMEGIVHALTLGKLEYMVMQLHRYFDPINAFFDDTASTMANDKGFLDLNFTIPTSDTTNYPSGTIDITAWVRCVQRVVPVMTKLKGYNARFQLVLEMIDPRFYEQTAQAVALNVGSTTSHTSTTEYPTAPVINLTMTGAASGTVSIQRQTPADENGNTVEFRLDLTKTTLGAAATTSDVVSLDMATGIVTLNGARRDDFIVAGYANPWEVVPGSNSFLVTGTNLTAAMAYTRAYS